MHPSCNLSSTRGSSGRASRPSKPIARFVYTREKCNLGVCLVGLLLHGQDTRIVLCALSLFEPQLTSLIEEIGSARS